MTRRYLGKGPGVAALAMAALLLLPEAALAQGGGDGAASLVDAVKSELDMTWIMVATVLVVFMQAGFLLLEIGFSRGKNAGAGVAKILVNLGILSIAWYMFGQGVNGPGNELIGTDGFFYHVGQDVAGATCRQRRHRLRAVRHGVRAPSRWRSSGARRSSASSSART